jgi:hypothetical protein
MKSILLLSKNRPSVSVGTRLGSLLRAGARSPLVRLFRVRALALGALALGGLMLGAFSIGALAIGRLALRRGFVGSLRIQSLDLGAVHIAPASGT